MFYAVKLGPIETADRATNGYFAFSDCDALPPVFERRDADGLRALVAGIPGEDVTCAPELKRAAKKLGLRVGPIPARVLRRVAAIAIGLAGGRHTQELTDLDVVDALATGTAEFLRAEPWRLSKRNLTIRASAIGTVTRNFIGSIFGARRPPPSMVLYEHDDPFTLVGRFLFDGDLLAARGFDCIGAIANPRVPAFAAQLVKQAYGLRALPTPVKVVSGESLPVAAPEAVVLAGALRAAALLTAGRPKAIGEFDSEDLMVSVEVEALLQAP